MIIIHGVNNLQICPRVLMPVVERLLKAYPVVAVSGARQRVMATGTFLTGSTYLKCLDVFCQGGDSNYFENRPCIPVTASLKGTASISGEMG